MLSRFLSHGSLFTASQILIVLEQEIEEALPQFQELIITLKSVFAHTSFSHLVLNTLRLYSHHDQPSKEALAARRRLVDGFGQYEKLAKQIRTLPTPNGPGSSQDRVQAAILARATNFLQKNMFPLQVCSNAPLLPPVSLRFPPVHPQTHFL